MSPIDPFYCRSQTNIVQVAFDEDMLKETKIKNQNQN